MNRNNIAVFATDMVAINKIHSKLLFVRVIPHYSGFYRVQKVVRDFTVDINIVDFVTHIYSNKYLGLARDVARAALADLAVELHNRHDSRENQPEPEPVINQTYQAKYCGRSRHLMAC